VKLFDAVMAWDREVVTTTITSGEFLVDSAKRVKWLMDISKIMDQQSKGIGASTSIIIVVILNDGLIDLRILVVRLIH
jgi:hypothetical protein